MHTGGPVPIQKPTHPMECVKHGLPFLRTSSGMHHDFWSCPGCNADVIDGWAKQPGVITIHVGK